MRQPVVLAWCSYCMVRIRNNYKMPSRTGKYRCFPVREVGVTSAAYEVPSLKPCQAVADL